MRRTRMENWLLIFIAMACEVVHIPGESNIWADIMSRWRNGGASQPGRTFCRAITRLASKASTSLEKGKMDVNILEDLDSFTFNLKPDEVLPSVGIIVEAQQTHISSKPAHLSKDENGIQLDK